MSIIQPPESNKEELVQGEVIGTEQENSASYWLAPLHLPFEKEKILKEKKAGGKPSAFQSPLNHTFKEY